MALGRLENLYREISYREKAGENANCSRSSCFPKQKLVMILELKVVDVVVLLFKFKYYVTSFCNSRKINK